MLFVRFLAAALLLVAVIAAVYDGTKSLAADRLVITPSVEHWSRLAPTSLKSAQNAVQRYTHPLLWQSVIGKVLLLPPWLLLGGLGVLLAFAGRRRRRVNIYAN